MITANITGDGKNIQFNCLEASLRGNAPYDNSGLPGNGVTAPMRLDLARKITNGYEPVGFGLITGRTGALQPVDVVVKYYDAAEAVSHTLTLKRAYVAEHRIADEKDELVERWTCVAGDVQLSTSAENDSMKLARPVVPSSV